MAVQKRKEKGKCEKNMQDGHLLIYTRVVPEARAAARVVCLIHGKHKNKIRKNEIQKWDVYSEHIQKISVKKKQ